MKQLVIAVVFITLGVIAAEPARFRNRFFARQQAEEAPDNGLYGAPPPTTKQPGGGYQYPKPTVTLGYGPPPTPAPETPDQPEPEPEQPSPTYLPGQSTPPPQPQENEEGDLDQPTEDVASEDADAEAVAGGDENDVENSQAEQFRQFRRLVRPLKLVDGRKQPQKFQRLVYYPVRARLEGAQPVVAAAAVPVAYVPENGFAYSSQVFHQQNW